MSSRRAARSGKTGQEGSPLWMVTYSDMVTLLLAFFILLYSVSVIDIERFNRILASIQLSFLGHTGILDSPPSPEKPFDQDIVIENSPIADDVPDERMREVEQVLHQVREFLAASGMQGTVEVKLENRGIVMELPDYIFFERSSAELRPEARQFLDSLSELLKTLENRIIIEGHTCNLPINLPLYPSNWELSVARSVRVTRYLVEVRNLDPARFTATGYGEYQPLQPNETAGGRAANRRVTIVIAVL